MRVSGMVLAAILLAVLPLDAHGQGRGRPLRVQGRQALDFATLLPSVPQTVLRTDRSRSGQFDVRGRRNALVMIQLTLPAALRGPGGATMPVAFGRDDGGFATRRNNPQVGFDPNAPYADRLSNNGRGYVFIGGTALPSPTQPPGSYSAPLVLMVADTGT